MAEEAWVEKYRPDDWEEVQGNNKALRQIREWADNWSPGDPPVLLVGHAGTGKTTTAYILADHLDCPLNEINTSSARTTEDVRKMAKAMRTTPADDDMQVVLLDEVDNWHHAADKQPLYDALKDPRNPVVLTANDEYDTPHAIKRAADTYEFKLRKSSRRAKLKEIAEIEDAEVDEKDIERLADRPDLRSAINDLQTWSKHGAPPGEDDRQWEMNQFSSVESLLKYGDEWKEALSVRTGNKGMRPSWAMLWADENVRQEFRGLEAGIAYDTLSRADKRLQSGFDSQARGLPYAAALLSLLPDTRLSEPYDGYVNVDFPSWVQQNESSHDDGSPEAELYNDIKTDRGYEFGGSFAEFKHVHLPILTDLPQIVRYRLVLNHGVSEEGMKALDVDPDQYQDWVQDEEPETGEWEPDTKSAADW